MANFPLLPLARRRIADESAHADLSAAPRPYKQQFSKGLPSPRRSSSQVDMRRDIARQRLK
jgi:hypothetical protein